jgi:hypothetical protein
MRNWRARLHGFVDDDITGNEMDPACSEESEKGVSGVLREGRVEKGGRVRETGALLCDRKESTRRNEGIRGDKQEKQRSVQSVRKVRV